MSNILGNQLRDVQFKNLDVTSSQRISCDDMQCGGWEAVNTGTATAYVDGYPLAPGEGVSRMQGMGSVRIKTPIEIQITAGARVHLTQAMYMPS